jgi:hypothetical protein
MPSVHYIREPCYLYHISVLRLTRTNADAAVMIDNSTAVFHHRTAATIRRSDRAQIVDMDKHYYSSRSDSFGGFRWCLTNLWQHRQNRPNLGRPNLSRCRSTSTISAKLYIWSIHNINRNQLCKDKLGQEPSWISVTLTQPWLASCICSRAEMCSLLFSLISKPADRIRMSKFPPSFGI